MQSHSYILWHQGVLIAMLYNLTQPAQCSLNDQAFQYMVVTLHARMYAASGVCTCTRIHIATPARDVRVRKHLKLRILVSHP